ncbi:glycogen debranching enzyme GlgX [Flaviflexus salsibiostraticola]|uniref:Glycogen debranching enzyme GlgX n=1 Tax=Flaviflexus salsibiostraticola TaxID=1282737 RepID=A0A3S8ZC46_9ACTO|nr:glycogen debranching enzyme GlgX [Flaviflexus salsibiostraticola]
MARAPEQTLPRRIRANRLGVTVLPDGIDVSVVSTHASLVEFCAVDIDGAGTIRERRFALNGPELGVWSGFIPGIKPGQHYGFRVHGRWDPDASMRHNPAKLLVDPYALGVAGDYDLGPAVYSHQVDDSLHPLPGRRRLSELDSAPHVPHSVVVDESYDGPVGTLDLPWSTTVIYEAHVRGLTMAMPGVPAHLRGTYAGVAHPATITHLKELGITALQLLPIHAKLPEPFLIEKGLTNYWGYNTLGFFAPEPSYATKAAQEAGPSAVLREVKGMVSLLHEAGIEVILDVVYNHTCEAGIDGPTLSWRGLGESSFYMQSGTNPADFWDVTGTGNSLDFRLRRVTQMALDSLRYWVEKVGIDGFRFDLAVTLGRQGREFIPHHPFYVAMTTDPVLRSRKLINEPWDLGPNGWRTGQFPSPTADWNDRFRNAVRSFWLTDQRVQVDGHKPHDSRELVTRLSGSADLFSRGRTPGGRGTFASINFITAHDGFTLRDLVTYDGKHNEANLEGNRDGTNDNRSWNHGAEGHNPELLEARLKSMRNLIGTLLLSSGTPMMTAGDEIARTQDGNNNPYCQDNELSWIDWRTEPWQDDFHATVSHLLQLRREHEVFRPAGFFSGTPRTGDSLPDVTWIDRGGAEMPAWKWFEPSSRTFQMLRSGGGRDVDALLMINGLVDDAEFTVPTGRGRPFDLVWDSAEPRPKRFDELALPGSTVMVNGQSIRLYLSNPS